VNPNEVVNALPSSLRRDGSARTTPCRVPSAGEHLGGPFAPAAIELLRDVREVGGRAVTPGGDGEHELLGLFELELVDQPAAGERPLSQRDRASPVPTAADRCVHQQAHPLAPDRGVLELHRA
jgi:hypothetical protein